MHGGVRNCVCRDLAELKTVEGVLAPRHGVEDAKYLLLAQRSKLPARLQLML